METCAQQAHENVRIPGLRRITQLREHDDVVMIEVVTDVFDRTWWREYAVRLAGRFHQEAIHIRALPMQLLDDDA
jgi:hypothetical protein